MDPAAMQSAVEQLQQRLEQTQEIVTRLAAENEQAFLAQGSRVQTLAEQVGELVKGLKKDENKGRRLMVDTKGLGRPEQFSNEETSFRRWARSIVNLTVGVYGKDFQDVLDYCLDQDDPIEMTDVVEKYGPGNFEGNDEVENLEDKADQLFRVLSSLTIGESEDLVVGCISLTGSGFEAWRRLNRRWDPVTAGRKRNILRAILDPERTKSWEGVRPALEQLDDLIRRYEARKNEAGKREVLSDDIKCTAVELLVPQDLEKHLILNKSRLTNYQDIKQEIETLMETVLGAKGKIHRPGT